MQRWFGIIMNLAQAERETFNIWGKELGSPMAASLRTEMKAQTLDDMGIAEADLDGDPDRQGDYLFQLENHVKGGLLIAKHILNSADGSNKQLIGTRRRYGKTFERRFHLVGFVITSWAENSYDMLNWEHVKEESRINWKRVTAEWNEFHPYDRFEKPISLKSLYNQAIRQEDILLQLTYHQISQGMKAARKEGQSFENQIKNAEAEYLSQVEKDKDGYAEWFAFLYKRFVRDLIPNQSEIDSRFNFIVNTLAIKYLKPAKGGAA